jgi:hypothetical protein
MSHTQHTATTADAPLIQRSVRHTSWRRTAYGSTWCETRKNHKHTHKKTPSPLALFCWTLLSTPLSPTTIQLWYIPYTKLLCCAVLCYTTIAYPSTSTFLNHWPVSQHTESFHKDCHLPRKGCSCCVPRIPQSEIPTRVGLLRQIVVHPHTYRSPAALSDQLSIILFPSSLPNLYFRQDQVGYQDHPIAK